MRETIQGCPSSQNQNFSIFTSLPLLPSCGEGKCAAFSRAISPRVVSSLSLLSSCPINHTLLSSKSIFFLFLILLLPENMPKASLLYR